MEATSKTIVLRLNFDENVELLEREKCYFDGIIWIFLIEEKIQEISIGVIDCFEMSDSILRKSYFSVYDSNNAKLKAQSNCYYCNEKKPRHTFL